MAAPQLSLPNSEIARCFSSLTSDAAQSLSSLISRQPGPDELGATLETTVQQLLLSCHGHRAEIDQHIGFLFDVANNIPQSIRHPGHTPGSTYKTTALRSANGPGIVAERLSHTLYEKLWEYSSRVVTPDEESDKVTPKSYYSEASIHASLLARAFALNPAARDTLWRDVEDIFVKSLFSGPEQEPGAFVNLAALLLGAGAEIRDYLQERGDIGEGRDWVWYNDQRNDDNWGWKDIVQELKTQPCSEMEPRLPDYVKESFETAKNHIGDGGQVPPSLDSKRLATKVFGWADRE